MKSIGVISEFNPFHNGHKYLLDKAKNELQTDLSITIMSGDFVQRGEPAIMDKFTRSKVAIKSGFDLVIEMPSFITLQSAEFFALKSVKILDKVNIDYLVFGVENIDSDQFLKSCKIVINNSEKIDKLTKNYLKQGFSYPKSHNLALEFFVNKEFLSSNNILALEYMRAIDKINSNIKPYPIRRFKTLNKDQTINNSNFASSTAIRNNINGNIQDLLPEFSYQNLMDFKKNHKNFDQSLIYNIFRYKILIEDKTMKNILGYEDGISNYFKKLAKIHYSYDDFLNEATNQRYTRSRIKRLILNYILENEEILNDIDISFIKILSYNEKAIEYFRGISKNTNLIINKKDINKLDKENKLIYEKMLKTSNLYNLELNREFNFDFKHNNRPIG